MEKFLLRILCLVLNCTVVLSIGCKSIDKSKPWTDEIDLQLVNSQAVPDGRCLSSRPVARYQQFWKGVKVEGYGATYNALTHEAISKNLATCIFLDLEDSNPNLSVEEALDIVYHSIEGSNIVNGELVFDPERDMRNQELVIHVSPQNLAYLVYQFDIRYTVITPSGERLEMSAVVMVDAKTGKMLEIHPYQKTTSSQAFSSIAQAFSVNMLPQYNMKGGGGNVKRGFYTYGDNNLQSLLVSKEQGTAMCYFDEGIKMYEFSINSAPECTKYDSFIFKEACDPPLNTDNIQQLQICANYIGHLQRFAELYTDWNLCEIRFYNDSFDVHSTAGPSIAAHEVAHAVAYSYRAFSKYALTSALDEAYADYCGVYFKSHIDGASSIDWHFASENFINNGNLLGVRHMDDPSKDGMSIQCTKHYSRFLENFAFNPHLVNGIFNKAFYNLVAKEDVNGNEFFEILLKAVQYHWVKSDKKFDKMLVKLIDAALSQYQGYKTNQSLELTNKIIRAFAKVGVYANIATSKTVFDTCLSENVETLEIEDGCPDGWMTLREKVATGDVVTYCFKIMEQEKLKYNRAKKACKDLNAHLAIIDTKKKDKFILAAMSEGKSYFLGAQLENNIWFWRPTDEFPGYENYEMTYKKNKIANTSTNYTCLAAKIKNGEKRPEWFKSKCRKKRHFICELACLKN